MKFFKPLVAFLVTLVTISVTIGILYPSLVVSLSYSPTLYLLLCVAQTGHFLEEYYTKAWEVEAMIRVDQEGVPKTPTHGETSLLHSVTC
ncbi:MAG: hypothetical protein ACXADS_02270 [Candidatus Thorarchaeota archaeon]|jgi:hypothetical protein